MKRFKTFVEQMVGYECSCCGNMINKEGKCGCGADCPHCGGQHTVNEEVALDEVSDKKLDAYRQKAFADQPAGDDGSNKYRKRKFGRDLAFAKQTGRAKVRATKEEVELDEAMDQKKFSAGAKAMKAYAQKYGGVDKKDFMEVSKLLDQIGRVNILQAGQLLTRLNRLVDGMDTDVRERIFIELKKVGLVESFEANLDEISKELAQKVLRKRSDQADSAEDEMKRNRKASDRYAADADKKRRKGLTTDLGNAHAKKSREKEYEFAARSRDARDRFKKADKKADKAFDYVKKKGGDLNTIGDKWRAYRNDGGRMPFDKYKAKYGKNE